MRFASWVIAVLLYPFAATAQPGTYVGSAACRPCHPDVAATFYRNPHSKTLASGNAPPERTGCESCHGPGKAHIEARGGKDNIVAFSLLSAKATLDACLNCHSKQIPRANIRRSPHSTGEVACSSCHSIHKSPVPKLLLAKPQPNLCYGCHTNIRAQFSMPSKHRVNEGFMQCTDCHNPHGTFAPTWRMGSRPKLVDQSLINEEACLKCHVNQRGPFAFEHLALRVDGCESCHVPHGSANARLLKRPAVFTLCLECHNGVAPFGPSREGVPTQSPSHSMTNPRYQNCTACHVQIHGSNGDSRFLR